MTGVVERAIGRLVEANNAHIARIDARPVAPRPIDGEVWARRLAAEVPAMREEWERVRDADVQLPLIDQLLGGPQGNEGSWWRVGVLLARGRGCEPLRSWMPRTVAALEAVPGMLSAMLSVLGPGGLLPPHRGGNAGALRLLVAIEGGPDAALELGDQVLTYDGGRCILFDDTQLHASWNHGDRPRAVLLCDVLRPLPLPHGLANRAVQTVHHLGTARYREAPAHFAEWMAALNPGLAAGPSARP